jgi:hypothetical protein
VDIAFTALCCFTLLISAAIGAAISFFGERYAGRWAYVIGWFVPVAILGLAYILYFAYVRATPCQPVGSLSCGEPLIAAFGLFTGVLCLTALGNAVAQLAVYMYHRQGRVEPYAVAEPYATPDPYAQPDPYAPPDAYAPQEYAPPAGPLAPPTAYDSPPETQSGPEPQA